MIALLSAQVADLKTKLAQTTAKHAEDLKILAAENCAEAANSHIIIMKLLDSAQPDVKPNQVKRTNIHNTNSEIYVQLFSSFTNVTKFEVFILIK